MFLNFSGLARVVILTTQSKCKTKSFLRKTRSVHPNIELVEERQQNGDTLMTKSSNQRIGQRIYVFMLQLICVRHLNGNCNTTSFAISR